jgi:DNA-binding HxlR family transcriptional regulator
MSYSEKHSEENCPIRQTLEILNGKWTFFILYALFKGVRRFKELERDVAGISPRMLVKELKDLEQHGILTRTVYAEVPPRVEYALTERGLGLKSVLLAMKDWEETYLNRPPADITDKFTIPPGIEAEINATNSSIQLLESAVLQGVGA